MKSFTIKASKKSRSKSIMQLKKQLVFTIIVRDQKKYIYPVYIYIYKQTVTVPKQHLVVNDKITISTCCKCVCQWKQQQHETSHLDLS